MREFVEKTHGAFVKALEKRGIAHLGAIPWEDAEGLIREAFGEEAAQAWMAGGFEYDLGTSHQDGRTVLTLWSLES